MNEEEQVLAILRIGAETTYYLLRGSVEGILHLIRYLKALEKNNLLSGKELKNFNSFLKATEGNFQLLNIPTENAEKLEEMRRAFKETGVTYMILPNLNPNDGMTQIAYYMPHTMKVEAWYRNFCLKELAGGEHSRIDLKNLTEGHTSIVNIPWNKDLELLKEDFDKLQINYAILPDLNVGDGYVQIQYADADAGKVRGWYEAFQKDFLKAGQWIDSFKPMSEEAYMNTGKMDVQEYIDTAPKEMKERIEKEGQENPQVFPEAPEVWKSYTKTTADPRYLQLANRPGYLEITINQSLVKQVEDRGVAGELFLSRIPGTSGAEELNLMLPRKDVFTTDDGKTFVTFLEANKIYHTFRSDLRHRGPEIVGHKLYQEHYAAVNRQLRKVRGILPTPAHTAPKI